MKKIIAFVLVFSMLLSAIPASFATTLSEESNEYEPLSDRLSKSDEELLNDGFSQGYIDRLRELQNEFSLDSTGNMRSMGFDSLNNKPLTQVKENVIININDMNRVAIYQEFGLMNNLTHEKLDELKGIEGEEIIVIYTQNNNAEMTLRSASFGFEWPSWTQKRIVQHTVPANGNTEVLFTNVQQLWDLGYTVFTLVLGVKTKYLWRPLHFVDLSPYNVSGSTELETTSDKDRLYTYRTDQVIDLNDYQVLAAVRTEQCEVRNKVNINGYDDNGRYVDDDELDMKWYYSSNWGNSTWIENQLIYIFENDLRNTVYDGL